MILSASSPSWVWAEGRSTLIGGSEKSGAVTESDAELFNALKACRAQLAAGKPAYVVFADSTLAAFATRRPLTPAAMLSVPGVGLLKLEKYAEPFLDVIRAHGP